MEAGFCSLDREIHYIEVRYIEVWVNYNRQHNLFNKKIDQVLNVYDEILLTDHFRRRKKNCFIILVE